MSVYRTIGPLVCCPAIMLMICYSFYSYDTISDDTELKQRLEGITHLVEHPSQMQPPGTVAEEIRCVFEDI